MYLVSEDELDQLEGLSERHAALTKSIERLKDQAAQYDVLLDPEQLRRLEGIREGVKQQMVKLLRMLLAKVDASKAD